MNQNVSFKKYLLTSAIGFGLGGLLWGWSFSLWTTKTDFPLTIPGAVCLTILGSLGLSIWSKNWKTILKITGLGLLGGILGFFIAFLGIYHLPIIGSFIAFLFPNSIINLFHLSQLGITEYWLNFALAGIIIGLFCALACKTKFWPMIWRGGTGFVLGSLIGPIIGNLIGNAVSSVFTSYLVTFSVIGIIIGIFLAWGAYKSLKIKN
jgi:hypothetical protein